MMVDDPLIRGCIVTMVEALLPVLRFNSDWLATVIDVLFAGIEFRHEENDSAGLFLLVNMTLYCLLSNIELQMFCLGGSTVGMSDSAKVRKRACQVFFLKKVN